MMAFDGGRLNVYGQFPNFQCAPLDKKVNCKWSSFEAKDQEGNGGIHLKRGQYCMFDLYKAPANEDSAQQKTCLSMKGHNF